MKNASFLKNQLLVAMPTLTDPTFHRAVTYIYEHDENGALGIVINKPVKITLGDVLKHLSIPIEEPKIEKYPVLLGGPVAQEQGFIIHPPYTFTSKPLAEGEEITISTSKLVLETIAKGNGPDNLLVSLGYAGWSSGQLEEEMAQNSWIVAPASPQILFHTPFHSRWKVAAASIGVDFDRLSSEVGHA